MEDKKLSVSSGLEALQLGTTVTTSTYEFQEITVDPREFFQAYGIALAKELQRRNPLKFDSLNLQLTMNPEGPNSIQDALVDYCLGLLQIRMDSIAGGSKDWRLAKLLAIPTLIQEIMSRVGKVTLRNEGLVLVPVMKEKYTYDIDVLLRTSSLLEAFQDDGLKLFKDAIPRSDEGDMEVMLCVLRSTGPARAVYAKTALVHPNSSYVAAILGLEPSDATFGREFRVRYDDTRFIYAALLKEVVKW